MLMSPVFLFACLVSVCLSVLHRLSMSCLVSVCLSCLASVCFSVCKHVSFFVYLPACLVLHCLAFLFVSLYAISLCRLMSVCMSVLSRHTVVSLFVLSRFVYSCLGLHCLSGLSCLLSAFLSFLANISMSSCLVWSACSLCADEFVCIVKTNLTDVRRRNQLLINNY